MSTIFFPRIARRNDYNGHMIVQENLQRLKDLVEGGVPGAPGPPGAQGPAGAPGYPPTTGHEGDILTVVGGIPTWEDPPAGGGGGGVGAATYVHTQGTPSSTWTVAHALGWFPSVTVVDTGESVIDPDIHYDSDDQVTLAFGSPTSGKAYLNPGGGVSAGGVSSYTHDQATPAATWTIIHNLGRYPSVTVADTTNAYVVSDVLYISPNEVRVILAAALAGRAYLV